MAEERLQKVLAQFGVASRRKSEKLIQAGKVSVNGRIVTELGTKVDWRQDRIAVEGKVIRFPEDKVYILLHKPAGYVTTVRDPEGRRTVLDLLKGIKERIFPVGRLDYETEGLLLLSNDGELAHALTHPRHEIEKIYVARVSGIPSAQALRTLRNGVWLADGKTAPARVKVLARLGDDTLLQIGIHEGRNRQIRRMCAAVGHPVLELKRIRMGPLTVDDLAVGDYRYLTGEEVDELRRLCRKQRRNPEKSGK
jgi:pseudouridine synthase